MAPASVFHSCSLITKECENQGCRTRENQQCSHSPLHCLLVPSSYCSYQVSFPSRWVHLPLPVFFMICLCCCILVSQILYPSGHSCFRLLAVLASAGCQLWYDKGSRAQDIVFPFQLRYPQSLQSLLARTNDRNKGLLLLCFNFVRNVSSWKCIQELCEGGICSVQLLCFEDKIAGVIWNTENLVKFGRVFNGMGKNSWISFWTFLKHLDEIQVSAKPV